MVKNIKYGNSFSYLGQEEHVETNLEQIRRNFLFCIKTSLMYSISFKMTLLGMKFDVISFYDGNLLNGTSVIRPNIQIVKEIPFLCNI